jgi:hypothetical protein
MDIGSTTSISSLNAQLTINTGNASATDDTSSTGIGPATKTSLSGPGQMFQQLQQLAQSDPTKFKEVVTAMAKSIRADAQNQTGEAATRLNDFASKLDQAAQSGDLSAFAPKGAQGGGPPPGPPPSATATGSATPKSGHHHHHGGGGGVVSSDIASALEQALSDAGVTSTT